MSSFGSFAAFIAACFFWVSFSLPAAASTIYTYVGNTYAPFPTTAPYTTSMSISGSFVLSSAVAPNQTNIDILGAIGSFSLSDGVNLYDQTTPSVFSEFRVTTDAFGNFVEWALELNLLNANTLRSCNATTLVATGICTGLVGDEVYDAFSSGGAANTSNPGVFTVVPEPSSALLLGMGLVGMALRRGAGCACVRRSARR